jgi:tetratricopeptide (TPR) repeat protein
MHSELDDKVYEEIKKLCDLGNSKCEKNDYLSAIEYYKKALELIPKPIENWEASTWVLAALGDCYFLLQKYNEAKPYLTTAMHCPGGLGNEFIHLRLGQVQFELGNKERAADELTRAYMGGGKEIFEGENEKYFAFLKTLLKGL